MQIIQHQWKSSTLNEVRRRSRKSNENPSELHRCSNFEALRYRIHGTSKLQGWHPHPCPENLPPKPRITSVGITERNQFDVTPNPLFRVLYRKGATSVLDIGPESTQESPYETKICVTFQITEQPWKKWKSMKINANNLRYVKFKQTECNSAKINENQRESIRVASRRENRKSQISHPRSIETPIMASPSDSRKSLPEA